MPNYNPATQYISAPNVVSLYVKNAGEEELVFVPNAKKL